MQAYGAFLSPILFVYLHIIYAFVALYYSDFSQYTIQFTLSSFLILLVYPVVMFRINLEKIIVFAGVLIALAVIFFSILFLVLNLDIGMPIFNVLDLSIGYRDFGIYRIPMVQLSATPVLFVAFGLSWLHWLNNRSVYSLLASFVILFAGLVSGQRGVFLLILLSFSIFIISGSRESKYFKVIIILMLISCLYFSIGLLSELFSSSDTSNSIKSGHINSYFQNVDLVGFLFGQGLGSSYYTEGYERIASVTEITILDSVRYFGIFSFALLWGLILNPLIIIGKLRRNIGARFWIFLGYIVLSTTNPVLFNSFGMFILVWFWSLFFNDKKTWVT
tara:strand:+ start:285 stop:1283 length:999 start_codon:yes stop_codon:yes gene_type:complete